VAEAEEELKVQEDEKYEVEHKAEPILEKQPKNEQVDANAEELFV
jgi:hypothetical protein